MAVNGAAAQQAFAPVLAALATMQGNFERAQKTQAHAYLEKFQKSVSTHISSSTLTELANSDMSSRKPGQQRTLSYSLPVPQLRPSCLRQLRLRAK